MQGKDVYIENKNEYLYVFLKVFKEICKYLFLFFVYVFLFCMYIYVIYMFRVCKGQNLLDIFKLELYIVVSCYVGIGNKFCFLNGQCSVILIKENSL